VVDRRIDDGQKLVLQLARDSFEVAAAFWLKAAEDAWAHLYLVSNAVDQLGPRDAYRAVQAALQRLAAPSVTLLDVKLISESEPLARAVRKLQRQSKDRRPITVRDGHLGDLFVEEAYLYPPLPRQKRAPVSLGKRRLRTAVQRSSRVDELVAPLTPQESRALEQLVATGISPAQAEYWVRKKREEAGAPSIPAGTVVDARLAAWWGDSPEDDPNPLLLVQAPDGAEGLTFKDNTDPE
jgi:hypothetical protein